MRMAGNAQFISSEPTLAWLNQFSPDEQVLLVRMLAKMRLISPAEFTEGLRDLILQRVADEALAVPVGLYAEREVRQRNRRPHALFKQSKKRPRRAHSIIRAIDPVLPWIQEVGSEGGVAQLITELARERPAVVLNHPNPTAIRKHQVRRFLLATDFIGSGKRVADYLAAVWRVWSVRSWWSARATKGMRFEVICYSATLEGRERVEALPFGPLVSMVAQCPTIQAAFSHRVADDIMQLCIRRDPVDHDPVESLGFKGTGALIAFAHSAPNNVPRILTHASTGKRSPVHLPLFPKRVTASSRATFTSAVQTISDINSALQAMGRVRLAKSGLVGELPIEAAKNLLVLAALASRRREVEVVAGRTSLTIPEVRRAILNLHRLGWINPKRRLTDAGHSELRKQPKARPPKRGVPPDPKSDYYPCQLRAPFPIASVDG